VEFRVFWDVLPCSHTDVDRRFRGVCCLHHEVDHSSLYVMLSCVGRGLCDELITRPEETYRASNCICDHRNPEKGPYVPAGNVEKKEKKSF
jgi:hypothetical protein